MTQTPQRPHLYGRHHQGSPKIFFIIYLLVAAAIGVAVVFLKPEGDSRSIEEMIAEEESSKEREAPKPAEKPKSDPPKPLEPEPEDMLTAKPPKPPKEEPEPEPKEEPEPEPESEKPALTAAAEAEIEKLYPFPDVQPLMEIVSNWENVPPRAFPKLVSILRPVDFEMKQGGKVVARGKLPAGSMMVPVQLAGDQLTLSGGGASPISVTIPVDDTDFKERIQSHYETFVEAGKAEVIAKRNAERQRRLGALEKEESLSDWNDGSDPRFDPIKASLQRGDVGIYSLSDAAKWRWGEIENIDGHEFQTAHVMIVSEAAFGVTEVELKVLMKDGKVEHWIDPATGDEI